MEDFIYECKTRILFGKTKEKTVGDEIKRTGAKKILIHYGSNRIKKSGLYDTVINSLNKAGILHTELSGVVPNPRLSLVEEGIKLCKSEKVDFVLTIGGGSVIDSGKAIAAGYYYKGDVWDLFSGKAVISKALPIGVILTLPASGSEGSPRMLIVNEKTNEKKGIASEQIRPSFAILNPALTLDLSKEHTAAGIIDMMTHIMERYFSNTKDVNLIDKMSEGALRAIIKNARLLMEDTTNYNYRADIMWAGTIAHNGLLGTGRIEDWAPHNIEHELSALYDIGHAEGLAVIYPAWMSYVYKQNIAKFVWFARKVWHIEEGTDEEIAEKGISRTKEFFIELGLPISLKEMGIDKKKFSEMAERVTLGKEIGNFVKLNKDDIIEIYKLAY